MKFDPFPGQVQREKTLKIYAFVKELIAQWLRSFVASSSPIMACIKRKYVCASDSMIINLNNFCLFFMQAILRKKGIEQ